jgi:hypothetical protein
MAADYLNHLAGGPIEVRSAGSEPADKISADSARAGSFPASPRVGHLSQSSRRTLRAFIETEKATLECGDLGDAVVARLTWWVNITAGKPVMLTRQSATWFARCSGEPSR